MNRWLITIIALMSIFVTACGTTEDHEVNTNENKRSTDEASQDETVHESEHADRMAVEPDEHSMCAYCNMQVYTRDHEYGVFSAKAISSEGEVSFLDDAGCALNLERLEKKTFDKYVRDYNSKEWLKLEEAVIVKADVKTPMNYGYAFFKNEEDAKLFMDEQGDDKASLSSVSSIDEIASERHKRKMEKMKNGERSGHGHNNSEGQDMSSDSNDKEDSDESSH